MGLSPVPLVESLPQLRVNSLPLTDVEKERIFEVLLSHTNVLARGTSDKRQDDGTDLTVTAITHNQTKVYFYHCISRLHTRPTARYGFSDFPASLHFIFYVVVLFLGDRKCYATVILSVTSIQRQTAHYELFAMLCWGKLFNSFACTSLHFISTHHKFFFYFVFILFLFCFYFLISLRFPFQFTLFLKKFAVIFPFWMK